MADKSKIHIALLTIMTAVAGYSAYQFGSAIQLLNNSSGYLLLWLVILIVALAALCGLVWSWKVKSMNAQLQQILNDANTDDLTGLANQKKLLADIEESQHPNLAFLKITNFNSILNTYGPAITDDVLKQIATLFVRYDHELLKKPSSYYIQPGLFAILEDQEISIEQIGTITGELLNKLTHAKYQVSFGGIHCYQLYRWCC